MNIEGLTDEEKCLKIAKACGWSWIMNERKRPDYLNDLNAMHEAEETLTEEQHERFRIQLGNRSHDQRPGERPSSLYSPRKYVSATARQRADAFLLTLR